MNLDEYLKTVGDYADQLAQAETVRDRDSLPPARVMADFYDSKEWVEIGLDLVPLPKNPRSNRALRPDTIERFHKVNNALLARDGRRGRFAASASTKQFIRAGQAARHIPKQSVALFRTEMQVRPLVVLLNAGYADRIPEAVNMAMDEGPITHATVARAARLVKHNAEQGRAGLGQHKLDRLRAKRVKAELAVLEFLDLAQKVKAKDKAHANEQLGEFKEFLKSEISARRG